MCDSLDRCLVKSPWDSSVTDALVLNCSFGGTELLVLSTGAICSKPCGAGGILAGRDCWCREFERVPPAQVVSKAHECPLGGYFPDTS